MRRYAWLKEPYITAEGTEVCRIMLYETEEGIYLFLYSRPDAVMCVSDLRYDSVKELYEDWDERIGERGWITIEDPLPYCQHDAFIPLRVKGRAEGRPEWGKYETLKDGEWVSYEPASS